eukprot:1160262-Pelagomonas_calceolata.AAC.3
MHCWTRCSPGAAMTMSKAATVSKPVLVALNVCSNRQICTQRSKLSFEGGFHKDGKTRQESLLPLRSLPIVGCERRLRLGCAGNPSTSTLCQKICAIGHQTVRATHQPNSPPECPNPLAAPPSLQVDPRMCPECPGGHLLQAGGGLLLGGAPKLAERSADSRGYLSNNMN